MNMTIESEADTRINAFRIRTVDNFPLAVTAFIPAKSNGEVILIGSATAVHQPYYRRFALFLAGKGYIVYTFDYRGIGKSRQHALRGFSANLQQWGRLDLDAMIRFIRMQYAGKPITYIGHSIGGQLPALTAESACFARVILVASQLTHWGLWPLHTRFGYALLIFILLPLVTHLWGYFPGKALGIFWDLPKGVALEIARWGRLRKGLFSQYADASLQQLRAPLLAIHFQDDLIAPHQAFKALVSQYRGASVTWHQYKPCDTGAKKVGHLGFFRRQFAETLWIPTLQWIEQTPVVEGDSALSRHYKYQYEEMLREEGSMCIS